MRHALVYNIKEDPEEHNNLASTMPNVLKELQSETKLKYQATVFDPDHGDTWPTTCKMAVREHLQTIYVIETLEEGGNQHLEVDEN